MPKDCVMRFDKKVTLTVMLPPTWLISDVLIAKTFMQSVLHDIGGKYKMRSNIGCRKLQKQ